VAGERNPDEVGRETAKREMVAGVRAFMGGITKTIGYWDMVASCDPLFKTTPLPTLISRWHYVLVSAGILVLVLCICFRWRSCSAALLNFCWRSCSAALFNFFSCCTFERSPESTHSGGSQRILVQLELKQTVAVVCTCPLLKLTTQQEAHAIQARSFISSLICFSPPHR
jgi:hypothetical protein